jgi:hypothetical protein
MKFLLVTLLALSSLSGFAAEISLPFQESGDPRALIVSVEINGKPSRLLLDTGSQFTVLSAGLAGVTAVELKQAAFASGPGLHGEAVWSTADLRLDNSRLDQRRVVVMNLDQVRKIYGKEVDGLLGQDILSEYSSVTLDFKNHRLILTK